MIPVANNITQVDEIEGEEIEFTIGDPRFVMRTQAELYSDVTKAIIREYSTNAYDAHVMAGHRDPIEVTLPTAFNPEFVVKDHGVGMDLDDFRQIYTRFGTSNKRHSNDLNGQLGYGSKSGVAYTASFQVTSVKNGVKNVGLVQRKPDWTIVLKVVATVKTSEPNGTEIRIPVHNVDEFNHKAEEFYSTWLPGRVLVNGRAPEHKVGTKIVDNLYYSEQWNVSQVVMGNVPYRIENPAALFRTTKMNQINFVAYVDDFKTADGSAPVEFTPSREDLKYTPRTKATLQAIVDEFEANIIRVAQEEIDNAGSHFEAYSKWVEWSNRLGRHMFSDLTYNGDAFESSFKINASRWNTNSYRNSVYHINQWDVANMESTMVVTEFSANLSSNHKAKAREYRDQMGWAARYILFTTQKASDIDSKWITKDQFVTWETLKAALPKKVRTPGAVVAGTGRIPGSFDYYTRTGRVYEKEVPKSDLQLFYISVQDSKRIETARVLSHLDMDNTVILLGANRIEKFKRDYPKVADFYKFAKDKVVIDGPSLLSKAAQDALDVSSELEGWLNRLPIDQLDDPEFARIDKMRKGVRTLTKAYDDNQALANLVGLGYNVRKYSHGSKSFGLFDKYPLMKSFNSYWRIEAKVAKEMVIYINAKFASAI